MKYFISAFLLLLASITLSADELKSIYLTSQAGDFEKMYEHFAEDYYIPVTVQYGDKTWADCRMRVRGDGSREYPKKSLKIKFDSGEFITGSDVLNLNAEYLDNTLMHQYLSTRLFNDAGLYCFKSEHAKIYLNGSYLGIYLMVENVDTDFLKNRGLDRNGNLYKATKDWASLGIWDDISRYWEKKTNENLGTGDLQELIDNINTVPEDDYLQWARETFNYENMVSIIAMNILISNYSTYYHNYHMFHDINRSGKWFMTPWDLDKTIGQYYIHTHFDISSLTGYPDNPYPERAFIDDQIFSDIKGKIMEFSDKYYNIEHLGPIIDSLKTVIRTAVEEDTTKIFSDMAVFDAAIDHDKSYIQQRAGIVLEQMQKKPKNFMVNPGVRLAMDTVRFSWHPSESRSGNPVKYELAWSTRVSYEEEYATFVRDLTDTTYTAVIEEGKYYWYVKAYDGDWETYGYDDFHILEVKNGTVLPCDIDGEYILTKENSPYRLNCDLTVSQTGKLKFMPGATLFISEGKSITIYGGFESAGTVAEPVVLAPVPNHNAWAKISFDNAVDDCIISHTNILNGSVYSLKTDVDIDHLKAERYSCTGNENYFFFFDSCNTDINNSVFLSDKSSEGIIGDYSGGDIINCKFLNVNDAVEYMFSDSIRIESCKFSGSSDDGIDLNDSKLVHINNCFFDKIADKAISIRNIEGNPKENIFISRNVIINSGIAVNVKDNAGALILNNTFYKNASGIDINTKDFDKPGNADVINCIFFENEKDISIESGSDSNVNYCISDNGTLDGDGNFNGNPLFVNIVDNNFKLTSGSPCINTGSPDYTDPDGSRSDIGAYYYEKPSNKLVINEINYNSHNDFECGDWVEFYNPADEEIDITNWYFSDGNDAHKFIFPDGTIIPADGYLVLSDDLNAFGKFFPDVKNVIGTMDFGLSASGELIRLYDNNGILVDSLNYDDKSPWPEEADGDGHSASLISWELDNSLGRNWAASKTYGTPGAPNDFLVGISEGSDNNSYGMLIYPQPAESYVYIRLPEIVNTPKISIIDITGNIAVAKTEINNSGDLIKVDISGLVSGVYFITIRDGAVKYKSRFVVNR